MKLFSKKNFSFYGLASSILFFGISANVLAQSCNGGTTSITNITTTSIGLTSNQCLNINSAGSINTSTTMGEAIYIGSGVSGVTVQNVGGSLGPAPSSWDTIINAGTDTSLYSSGTISSTNGRNVIDNYNSSTFSALSNTGTISATGGSYGVYNHGTIGALSNTGGGSISSANATIVNDGTINSFSNDADSTISATSANANVYAITNDASATIISLTNTGTISAIGNSGASYSIFNFGAITSLLNGGEIIGENSFNYAAGIYNSSSAIVTLLTNNGIIKGLSTSSVGAGVGVWNEPGGSILTLINSTGSTIWGSGVGIGNSGIITTLTNSGVIGSGGSWGISNVGTITTLNNSGTISAEGAYASGIYNGGTITTLSNSGIISAGDIGIGVHNTGAISTLSNSGIISVGVDGTGIGNARSDYYAGNITALENLGTISTGNNGFGIANWGGTIGTLNNLGTISVGNYGVGIKNTYTFGANTVIDGSITTLNNLGTIFAGNNGVGISNNSTISNLTNWGTISIGNDGDGIDNSGTIQNLTNSGVISANRFSIYNDSIGTITSLTNLGTISAGDNGTGIWNYGIINNLINSGTISAGNNGTGIFNTNMNTLTNIGAIFSGVGGIGINNSYGTITTLNNAQGGNSSSALTTALNYVGSLPTNYNIIINSTTHYGQLSAFNPSGVMAFNIYGNTGTTLISGVSASAVTSHRYLNVLSGLPNLNNITGTTGTYGSLTYSLVADLNTANSWDLLFGPSLFDTQSSLQLLANGLKGVYAIQTSAIRNGLTYDCNVFDKNGVCVSAGGRYDRVNTGDTHATNGLLIGSYKVDANTRVGAWVDQNLSASSATGVNLNNGQPMFGVFGVWNADKSGNGFEARLSAGYGDKDLTTTRQVVGTSEAGTGKTRLNTQGVSVVASYNIPVAADLTVSPYLGARYTRVNANGYTEATSSAVTAPLTLSALKQETTTALAGFKVAARMSPECGVFGSIGAELDTSNKGNNYSATGVDGLTAIAFNADTKRLRGVASVGTYYDLDKTQRISLNAVYREEAFQKVNTLSTMATYTAGF